MTFASWTGSSCFQPGEGPSRGLLCDYEPSDGTFWSTTTQPAAAAVVGKKSAKNVDLIWSAAGLAVSVWMGYFNDVTIGRSKRRLWRWPSVSPLSAEILMVGADRDFPYGIKQTLTLSTSKWKICWKINLVVNALAAFCSLSLYLREIFPCDFSEVSVCMQ